MLLLLGLGSLAQLCGPCLALALSGPRLLLCGLKEDLEALEGGGGLWPLDGPVPRSGTRPGQPAPGVGHFVRAGPGAEQDRAGRQKGSFKGPQVGILGKLGPCGSVRAENLLSSPGWLSTLASPVTETGKGGRADCQIWGAGRLPGALEIL